MQVVEILLICGIHLRATSQDMLMNLIHHTSSKITLLNLLPNNDSMG